jgi:hypothetical protein
LRRLRKMLLPKARCLLIAFCSSLIIPYSSSAQIYFQDDFSQGDSKWVDIWGQWEVEGGEYHQSLRDDNCMSVVADEFWQEEWVEYTFRLKAKKLGGAEGFLIMFRLHGALQPRGRALRDLPPRMNAQTPTTQYWWNLGGWANVRSCVERWINGALIEQANTGHTINTGEWYEIKIENRADSYTLFLNDEKIADVQDSETEGGRIGLATWQTEALFDDVIVYGPEGEGMALNASGKLPIKWGLVKSAY